ncbi:MAG: hypothetical protein AAF965_07790 [Pseudomonadota bacterium]
MSSLNYGCAGDASGAPLALFRGDAHESTAAYLDAVSAGLEREAFGSGYADAHPISRSEAVSASVTRDVQHLADMRQMQASAKGIGVSMFISGKPDCSPVETT